jgi:hypothetical protein
MLVWLDGKDAAENPLDYDIDWTLRLKGDTIAGSTWSITTTDGTAQAPTLQIQSSSYSGAITKVWLIGGTPGVNYELQNQVTLASGGKPVENVQLLVKHR